jgi:hypothetical protein
LAQFRTTADLVDDILTRSGETTNGNSQYEEDALRYLNRVHHSIIAGGNEFNVDVDEPWKWAKAKQPIIIELQPKVDDGTISLTQGSEVGTFSSAPAASLKGWFLRIESKDEMPRIAKHVAGETGFELDAAYTDDTGAGLIYKAFKLDYELVPTYIIVDSKNDKLDFEEVAATNIVATLDHGSYTPTDYIAQVVLKLDAAASATITGSYDADTRKFSLISDLAGAVLFKLQGATGPNQKRSAFATLGYDDEDRASAASHESVYVLGGISRLFEPMRIYRGNFFSQSHVRGDGGGNITSMDEIAMKKRRPLTSVIEGNPSKYAVIEEDEDGRLVARFNRYPEKLTRVEIEYIPVPRDLKDNAASIPLIPRKFIDLLEYGAASYVLIDKEDNKAATFAGLAKQKLDAMLAQNRNTEQRSGEFFGQVVSRPDLIDSPRRLIYGEPIDQ